MFARRILPVLTAGTTLTPFAINQTGGGLVDLKITTSNGTPVIIDWGDGTTSTAASGVTASRTYAATYTGNVTVRSAGPLMRWESSNGKWSFDISSLPAAVTSFYCGGSNTVSGNLSSLPAAVTSFYCTGSNTITGNLSSLPAVMTSFLCGGSNTVSGNLSSLPAVMTSFYCTGSNTISDYVSRTWANNQSRVYLIPVSPGGLSSAEIDQLLIDLAAAGGTWVAPKEVNLKGTNAARTVASAAAVATLQGKGVTVTTN